jgi:hypothetical protein
MKDEERKKIYKEYKEEVHKREFSNSESFDKAILSLSSAGLAISLTYIKSIVPIEEAVYVKWLYATWILLGLSIISTITSFMTSQSSLKVQLKIAKDYYIDGNQDAINKENLYETATKLLNWVSGVIFISAIVSVIIFSIANFNLKNKLALPSEQAMMKKNSITTNDGKTKSEVLRAAPGQGTPDMDEIPDDEPPPSPEEER